MSVSHQISYEPVTIHFSVLGCSEYEMATWVAAIGNLGSRKAALYIKRLLEYATFDKDALETVSPDGYW